MIKAMAKQVVLDETLRFSTRKAALGHFRQILYAYEPGDCVTDPEHEELVFVLDYGQGYLLTRRRGPMTWISSFTVPASIVCGDE